MSQNFVDASMGAQPSESSSCTGCSGEPSIMPIAIIGMGCRLPGTATNPDGLWNMLSNGMSGWSQSAGSRFKMDAFYHPATEMNGAFSTKGVYLLRQDITHFDNQFFNISPIEAKAIDPQQRLLLEVAYEAFEHAGITSESLSSSNTGVYCAVSNHDYENIQGRDPEHSPMYRFTGTGIALVSNRISYCFNLNGPSITLDTACSGSLVAVHEACKAIRCGEIQQALVGGSNLILDPERISVMSSLQFLSDHGRCYSFDSRANGFGRGEGVAAIVLKPLNDALRDGDPIQAVIRGSAVNSDGRTAGITMPSKDAQVSMMRKAYADAELDPKHTTYIEAHGTGTQVGDKIESAAIAEVFSPGRPEDSVIYVGSVKTNMGHAESAAGLAGLLKSVLILKNGKIPPNLNFAKGNKHLRLEDWKMKIPQRLLPWPENEIRRASINSFGYGGTNAHVILEAPDSYMLSNSTVYRGGLATPTTGSGNGSVSAASSSDTLNGDWIEIGQNGDLSMGKRSETCPLKRYLFVLTHDNEGGIVRLASDLKRHFSKVNPDHNNILESLAYTLSLRRSRHSFRVAAGATNLNDLLVSFENISRGISRPKKALDDPKICFAFTGQGTQWSGMGRELLNNYPIFAESMSSAETYLSSLGAGWALLTELNKELGESRANEAALSQPCCTAIQLGLVDLMRSWGIRPQVVCGHSSGEIAAAYAAGFITRYDALNVAFQRGKCVANLARQHPEFRGRMLAAGVSEDKAQKYILQAASKSSGRVAVACVNSPTSVTLSGDECAVIQAQADLESDGIFNRLLQVDIAYHSHHMKAIQNEYMNTMGYLRPVKTNSGTRMVSSVTGIEIYAEQMTADYWVQNLVSPVRFSEALEHSLTVSADNLKNTQNTANIILEIGPHSALKGPIKQILKTMGEDFTRVSYHSALVRNVDAVKSTTDMAGDLFACGVRVCFDAINDPCQISEKTVLTNIPSYSWQHTTSHWSEGRVSSQYRQRQFPRHDLLGVLSHDCLPTEPTWRNFVRQSELPWLKGHAIDGQTIFPASGYICMALEALRQGTIASGRAWKNILCSFRQIVLERALLIPDDSVEIETYFTLRKFSTSARELSSDWEEFRVFSVSDKGEVAEHCRGLVSARPSREAGDADASREHIHYENSRREELVSATALCRESVDPNHFYESLRSLGVDYTSPFANLTEINSGGFTSLCRLTIPDTKQSMPGRYQQPHVIHPGTLDSCFHAAFPVILNNGKMTSGCIVSNIDAMDISSDISNEPMSSLFAHAIVKPNGRQRQLAEIIVTEPSLNGQEVISIKGLGLTLSGSNPRLNEADRVKQYHKIEWSMDSANATNEDVRRICRAGVPVVSAFQHRATCDHYVQVIIQNILTSITPVQELNMADHHKKFMQWMRARKPVIKPNANSDLALRERVKSFGIDGEMLVHIGDHLVDILKGQVDPLSVMMQDDLLFRVYASENISRCNLQLVNYIRQLQFKNPQMRVLEIGAGTANTAAPLLEGLTTDSMGRRRELAKFEKYVFTDISSGFFEKAKAKLEHFGDLVEYKKLDIEKPVGQQGFEIGSFDLIVASNVLHATASISTTLQNVRALLKPQGTLALIEITNAHSAWPLIFGPLPGWWLGASDGRLDSPLLGLDAWNEALNHAGFSGVDVALKDYEPAYEHGASLMVSSAMPQTASRYPDTITVVCGDYEKGIANALSDLIAKTRKSVSIQQKSLTKLDPTDTFCVVLLEIVVPFLASCGKADFQAVMNILLKAQGILWVTRGAAVESCDPDKALIFGLSRTLRLEDHSLSLTTLDLDPTSSCPFDMAQQIDTILGHVICLEGAGTYLPEYEYAVRNGTILIPRLVEDCPLEDFVQSSLGTKEPTLDTIDQRDRALGLEIETPGLLETFYWTDSALHSRPPTDNEVRIRVSMAALNFKDVMTAMGQLEDFSAMLIECSGTVIEVGGNASTRFSVGDRVCAIGLDGVATSSNIDQNLVHQVPDEVSLEVAAAIPVSYATALYALRDVARIQPGESILIHSAAGAFGQAAIAIAKYFSAGKIFVTVGNAEKKSLIMESFGIPEEHIFSSRGLSFASGIRRQTQGQGVDVILNALRGEARRESQNCLNKFGRFIELGMKDLLTNAHMEMQYLLKNSTFAVIDLVTVARHKPWIIQDLIKSAIELIYKQKVQLLQPITVALVSKLEDTFRLMQTGKHMGKLVVELDSQSLVKVRPQTPCLAKLNNESAYLVAGGLGGLGRAVIRYLVSLGAKNIATLSRSGAKSPSKEAFVNEMKDLGVNLIIYEGSVTNMEDIERLKAATREYPIRGIVQGAMVLQDSVMPNMTYAQWQAALGPKVTGTWNLHSAFGSDLDFFIILSSATGIIGSQGQGNYAAGGTFQDAFARYRASLKLPVRTIDLSSVEAEGYAAENHAAATHAQRQGLGSMKLDALFALLNHAITDPTPKDIPSAQVVIGTARADPASYTSEEASIQRADPMFSHTWIARSSHVTSSMGSYKLDLRTTLSTATSRQGAVEAIQSAVVGKLSQLLAMPVEDISGGQSVSSYGADSLVAVELRNWVSKQLEAHVQIFELMSGQSIHALAKLFAGRSHLVPRALFASD